MNTFCRKLIPALFAFLFTGMAVHNFGQNVTSTRITKIQFEGNKYFSAGEMLAFIASKEGGLYSNIQFDLDLKNVIKNYQEAGYIECRISSATPEYNFDSSAVSIVVHIDEGKQVLIGEVIFEGNKLFKTSYLNNVIETKPGGVMDALKLNRDLTGLLELYENNGYTFASINVEEIDEYESGNTKRLRVRIKIDENERIRIDNIVIEGNTSTKENVIVREIRLGENNTVSRETLIEVKRRLENLGYFESVEQPRILKYKNSTVLQIKVKEGNTNTFDGILGYVPPSQTEDKGYFTGFVDLSIRNLFGTGRKVEAKFRKEVKTTQELELRYLEPWLLGYPVNVNFGFLQRIEDSTYIKRDLSIKADALITKKFTLSALFNFERVIPSLTVTNNFFSIFDSRLLSAGVEVRFDSRDYVYNPLSGILYRTSYSVGQKKIYNASAFQGQDIPSDFTVQKGVVDLDFFHSFFKRQSSLIGVHGVEIRSPRFEAADLYRLGGINSVRGYREGQFLASRTAWSNIELRYSLTRRSFAAIFYDMGYYRRPADEFFNVPAQEGFIYGYGLGIRVETALGMFGVSYALGKGDSILEGKIHFGLVNDF